MNKKLGFHPITKNLKFLLVAIPIIAFWFVLFVYPNLEIFVMAFQKWDGFSPNREFVGLQNFKTVFTSPRFDMELKNSVEYIIFLVLIQTGLSLVLALALQKNTRTNRAFRTFFFLPQVLSSVMVGLTFSYMFVPGMGILDTLLNAIGFESMKNYVWLQEGTQAILCIVLVHVWANVGFSTTILISGLQTVPIELHEAASIDGANGIQRFFKITLPLIMPTLLRVLMMTFIGGALAFDYVMMLGSRSNLSPFDTWAVSIFKSLRTASNQGILAAKATILSILLFGVFALQYWAQRKAESIKE